MASLDTRGDADFREGHERRWEEVNEVPEAEQNRKLLLYLVFH